MIWEATEKEQSFFFKKIAGKEGLKRKKKKGEATEEAGTAQNPPATISVVSGHQGYQGRPSVGLQPHLGLTIK